MMRNLASVQKILNIEPIEGADKIEKATVLGWECVIAKKDNFKVGDLVVYIEIDSIVPDKPEFEFLRDRKFRVKTIKLRNQISQGLVMPLSILPTNIFCECSEGDDLTEILGIKKYNPELEQENKLTEQRLQLQRNRLTKFLSKYSWYRRLFFKTKKDSFPKFIKKTDETRLQNMPHILEQEKDTFFDITEKIDGTSSTYFLVKNPKRFLCFGQKYIFGVCSRNLQLNKEDDSPYWTIARQYNIKEKLETLIYNYDYVILQGEIIGNKIQGNKYKICGYDFYTFNLIYPNLKIPTTISTTLMDLLDNIGIKTVPILNRKQKLKATVNEMVELSKGQSVLYPTPREGIVVRSRNPEHIISFKVINPDFLLKNDD